MPHALLLSGSLGQGHDVMAQACADTLHGQGWTTETADAMGMLGPFGSAALSANFDAHRPAGGGILHRVFEQIRDDLFDAAGISHQRARLVRQLEVNRVGRRQLWPAMRPEIALRPRPGLDTPDSCRLRDSECPGWLATVRHAGHFPCRAHAAML